MSHGVLEICLQCYTVPFFTKKKTFLPLFDRALQIWDMEQDKLVLVSDRNRVSGLCCAFHPRGSVIATG